MRRFNKRALTLLPHLANPVRLQILVTLLDNEPLTVSQLMAKTQLDQATVSQHLRSLRGDHVVGFQKNSNYHIYSVTEPLVGTLVTFIININPDKNE